MAIAGGHIVVTSDFDVFGITAYKTGDESVTSSTTLQNDDLLVLPVVAAGRYIVECYFTYTGAADPGGGLKMGWTGPSGSTMRWATYGTNQGTLTTYDVVSQALGGGRVVATNSGTEMSCHPYGVLNVGGTSGNLQLQWAQGTSNATPTILKAGSFVHARRIA